MAEILRMPRAYNPGEVGFRIKVPIGSAGAVGTVVGKGVTSVTLLGTGSYRITFERGFAKLLHFNGGVIAAANALLHTCLEADYTAGANTLDFKTKVQAGTDTAPASGDTIVLDVVFDGDGLV